MGLVWIRLFSMHRYMDSNPASHRAACPVAQHDPMHHAVSTSNLAPAKPENQVNRIGNVEPGQAGGAFSKRGVKVDSELQLSWPDRILLLGFLTACH